MGSDAVLNSALSVITLLFVATVVAFLLRRSKIPYSVVLVLAGILVGLVGENIPLFVFLEDFRLSPDLVFYVFLPTLIFESAFNTNLNQFTQSIKTVTVLSTVGMLISMFLIGAGMHYLLDFPWAIALLFGALISATDPISVLAMFKKIGAPKRLSTIVEGESLFNDGTALVLFGILLEIVRKGEFGTTELLGTFGNFGLVVFGGIATGLALGFLFSKALDYVKNSKEIEISITLILAHFTFILAEYFLGVSGILATVAAGIVLGNYGAFKISPDVKEIMTHFWDYSAFLANSLLFLLVGIIIFSTKDAIMPLLLPTILVILIVMLARMLMIYSVLPAVNVIFPRERIPTSWIHIIQWSGLRGALAIALILTLPSTLPFYEEMLIYTVGVIFFTIIFNGFTISPLINALGLKAFSIMERFEHDENKVLIDQKVHTQLKNMRDRNFISDRIYKKVNAEYMQDSKESTEDIRELFRTNEKDMRHGELSAILKRHILGVEKRSFLKLYHHGEITQELLNILLNNVNRQMETVRTGEIVRLGRLTNVDPNGWWVKLMTKLGAKNLKDRVRKKEIMLRYEMYRARLISTSDVLEALKDIKETNVFINKELIKEFESRYKTWCKKAEKKLTALEKEDSLACEVIQIYLAKQAAFHVEKKMIAGLNASGMTSPKVYNQLIEDLEARQGSQKI